MSVMERLQYHDDTRDDRGDNQGNDRRQDMAEVVLFHSVLGQTRGFQAFADDLRAAGHTVHTPDVLDGQTFDDVEAGVANIDAIGFDTARERAVQAAADLPAEVVYAGFSFGAMPAEELAITRRGAVGALLFDSCAPPSYWGGWPAGVPVQVHGMEADPWFAGEDLAAARDLAKQVEGAELFLYPGDAHLFTDRSMPWHDGTASELLLKRVLAFLGRL
jgi:dienelactone hydrolase